MMKLWMILKEQFKNIGIIFRIASYDNKASYQGHYLGLAWEFLNPTIQIATFYVVFGLGLRRGQTVDGVEYISWMLIGMAVWFFMNKTILECSISIQRKITMVSKMKFPVSVLPTITIVSQLKTFFIMLFLGLASAFATGIMPTWHWIQFIYYFVAMMIFLFVTGVLTSTITILIQDFHFILQAVMRLLFYISGAIMVMSDIFPGRLGWLSLLNPFYYIIGGFRNVLLYQGTIGHNLIPTAFFWTLTIFIGLIAAHLHLKFRSRFMDFV